MKVSCWFIGKTAFPYLKEGMAVYEKRLGHYLPFESVILPDVKNAGKMKTEQLKKEEAKIVLSKVKSEDYLVLLDEKGRQYSSVEFAQFLEKRLQASHRRLIFLVGGAFGFAPELYERAQAKLSLSKMTFSHQMVRLFFLEQVYRAMTILRGEKYHNS